MLEKAAAQFPEKVALVCQGRQYTYREIDSYATCLASFLIGNGLKPQDRVVIYLENSFESVVSLFGILKAGGIFVMLNPALKARRLGYILTDTGAVTIIAPGGKVRTVQDALAANATMRSIIWVAPADGAMFEEIAAAGLKHQHWEEINAVRSDAGICPPSIIDVDLAALIYTSGSSGDPKGVMCAHYNMIAAVQSINEYIQNRADDIILNLLPLSFDYGLYQVFLSFHAGATLVLERTLSYPYEIVKLLEDNKITGFPIVPTIAAIIARMGISEKHRFENLRYITSTGDTLSVELIQRLMEVFPNTRIFSMYGLTECKRVSYLPPDHAVSKPTSVGIPIPNSDVFVVDEQGHTLGPGKVGELVVRGSHVMQGYWRSANETRRKFKAGATRSDVLLYTGDFFKMDEAGFLYFMGRKSDVIKHKGERISPREIETFLNGLEGILQSAVVGIPDDVLGQRIVAFVVMEKISRRACEKIFRCCREQLESYLVPQCIVQRESLPVLENGKINKAQLIQEYGVRSERASIQH